LGKGKAKEKKGQIVIAGGGGGGGRQNFSIVYKNVFLLC
jgi:hypothetical protein